jgi:hypothetical protein
MIGEDEIKLENNAVNELSDKDANNQHTSESCKTTLAKVNTFPLPFYRCFSD